MAGQYPGYGGYSATPGASHPYGAQQPPQQGQNSFLTYY